MALISKNTSLKAFLVLWQHVFQAVVCVLIAMQCATHCMAHTPQPETHVTTTLHGT
jgi:hypothetical protein